MAIATTLSVFATGDIGGQLIAYGTGTTNGTGNTATTVAHGAVDRAGAAFTDATKLYCIAFPTSNAGGLYEGAAPTVANIDIRSAATSVPYRWFLFYIG